MKYMDATKINTGYDSTRQTHKECKFISKTLPNLRTYLRRSILEVQLCIKRAHYA